MRYASAVYQTTHVDPRTDIWTIQTLWPLLAMVVLAVVGIAFEYGILRGRGERSASTEVRR